MINDHNLDAIHPHFADWYSEVDLRSDEANLDARWKGVASVAKSADYDDVEALVRLSFGARMKPPRPAIERIRQEFRDCDETFETQGNDRELEILAGACLVAIMDDEESMAAAAALAITTAELAGARQAIVPMDLLTFAENAIDRLAGAVRQRPELTDENLFQPPKIDFDEAVQKINENQHWSYAGEAFKLAAGEVRTTVKVLAESQRQIVNSLSRFLRIQDEELQILWWIIGQRSWEYDCPFDDIPALAKPLVLANELARNTEFLPGPPSIVGLLSRAGLGKHESLTIPEAINAADPEWLAKIVREEDQSPVSCPIHFGIKRQLETGAGDAWVPGWAATTQIEPDHAVSPIQLGLFFYRERLLAECT